MKIARAVAEFLDEYKKNHIGGIILEGISNEDIITKIIVCSDFEITPQDNFPTSITLKNVNEFGEQIEQKYIPI